MTTPLLETRGLGLHAAGRWLLQGLDWRVSGLHTPGHCANHLCFALESAATEGVLFSADHVMSWSTSIVSPPDGDMAAYMTSLARLSAGRWSRFLPGHGDPVEDPDQRLADLTHHRLGREAQILAALKAEPASIPDLTARVYVDTPRHLLPAAERNVFAHLVDLHSRGLVTATPALHPDAGYALA